MTLPQIISRNQIQKNPIIVLNERKVLSGGTDGDFYTCPTGKKATIKGFALMTGLGAAGNVRLVVAGVIIAQWAAGGNVNTIRPRDMEVLVQYNFEVGLVAGEILQYTQDSGTNAEMNINAEILETPA